MEALAINGGKPVRDLSQKPWPSWPVFGEEERRNLLEVFESGKWFFGEKVKEFEERFAAFQQAKYGVSCNSGTTALEMALYACRIGAGDEVIIPAYTFMATASAVVRANAVPVFADIDLETCNLDPGEAERKLSERTRAIIPVHIAGLPADMDGFRDLAQKYNLKIIEDACHSWGSRWRGKGTGALGDCGVFSFQMSKNITSGEGGLLVTDKEEIAETARSFSNCGREETAQWYQHFRFGTNIRMTEFQAAILLAQLSRLEEQTRHREATARVLDEGLRNIPGIKTVPRDGRVTRRAYHLYVFRFIEEDWKISRDRFLELLKAEGIPASAGYSPLYRNLAFHRFTDNGFPCALTCPRSGRKAQYENVFCPAAEKASQQTVWLPHWLLLAPEEEMEDVVCAVKKIRAAF